MPVYFVQEASGVGKAVFRPTESAEDVFLCSIDLTAYSEPRVRDLFTESRYYGGRFLSARARG